jgi:putative transposase
VTGFWFVDEHQAEHQITDLCRIAGVARSSFYAWRNRTPSQRQQANDELLVGIREIHEQSRRTYGAPRVTGQLRRRGHRVGHNRVARLMADNHLVGAHARRKFRRGRHPKIVPAPDLLQRDFTASAPNLRWVADISEFRCWDGKLYLAGIRDLHDHTLVGWSMGERQTTDLVIAALVMALGRRQPGRDLVHWLSLVNTLRSSSPTDSTTGASSAATAPSGTASTTPPWRATGRR